MEGDWTRKCSGVLPLQKSGQTNASQLADIDISELENVGDVEVIGQSLISLRLRIAGYDANEFHIEGAEKCKVRRIENKTIDEAVVESVRSSFARAWNLDIETVDVQLSRPLHAHVSKLETHNVEVRPVLSGEPKVGAVQVRFGAYESGKLLQTFTAAVVTTIEKELPIARVPLKPGTILRKEHFSLSKRRFQTEQALHATRDVVGKEVARTIRPGQLIDNGSIRLADTQKQKPIVIRRRSLVRLVAKKNGLTVSIPQAEALDDGAVGDTIRVRNLQSRKVVSGRVESSNSIRVSL